LSKRPPFLGNRHEYVAHDISACHEITSELGFLKHGNCRHLFISVLYQGA
jgi:hypothetical protein